MQLRLVRDDAAEAGCAVAFVGQGEVTEPGRPVVVEVPGDPKPVAGGHLSFWGLGHEDPTFVVALMAQPAPRATAQTMCTNGTHPIDLVDRVVVRTGALIVTWRRRGRVAS